MNKRSDRKELMDLGSEYYTQSEYEECLKKLFLVGKYTGMHSDTFKVLGGIRPKTLLDVGCGDGAFLATAAKRLPETMCRGIDIAPDAIGHAERYKSPNVDFACSATIEHADVIMANLVCHHMTDVELEAFLQESYSRAGRLVLINDLQRSRVSKALFGMISGPLFSNRLISHDGKISIERGFRKQELEVLIKKLCPHSYTITWRFPFRWQVLLWKK